MVALKITNNINVLIKVGGPPHSESGREVGSLGDGFSVVLLVLSLQQDLFHNPPSFKSTVTLSWKPVQKPEAQQP